MGRTLEQFRGSLLEIMERKNHWAWEYFSGNKITKAQLKIHYRQEFAVYVLDFPVFLSRIHAKNPPLPVRQALAANLFEEDTGGLSLGRSHPELFLQMMEGLGFEPREFRGIRLLPKSRRYRTWLDRITLRGSWLEAAAAVTIFVEGSVKDRKELESERSSQPSDIEEILRNHPLVRFHNLDPKYLDLIRAHQAVEKGHRSDAWRMVLENALSSSAQAQVQKVLNDGLRLWLAYRDGVAAACQLPRRAP